MKTLEKQFVKSLDNELQSLVDNYDWDCASADTQYLTHSIHRYSGKFIPQIAQQAINLLTKPGSTVLDPYCGSGTTLLESYLNNRGSIGLDLNPLAILISRVKTTPVSKKLLDGFVLRLEQILSPLLYQQEGRSVFDPDGKAFNKLAVEAYKDPRWKNEWFKKWFKNDIRLELIIIYNEINKEKNQDLKNIGLVAFSDILRQSSNAHSSYPNVMFDKNKLDVSPATPRFINKLKQVVNSIIGFNKDKERNQQPEIVLANACNMPFEDQSIDCIITHPPYIGSIPYAEYGLLSLHWLGYNANEIDKQLTGGKRQSKDVVERFMKDFNSMIKESFRVLKSKCYFFMLIGNPVVKGEIVELDKFALEFAIENGFLLSASTYRKGINRRANLMGKEVLLFFNKP